MYKILVIDDEIGILEMCRRVLTKENYAVTVSSSGEEALRLLAGETFDLIVSDLKMPGVDGLEVLSRAKASRPETEVIIITGQASIESAVLSLKGGAFDYLLKPFSIAELLSAVKKCLEFGHLKRRESIFRETTYLYQLAQAVITTKPEKELLEFLLERAVKAFNADGGSLYTFSAEGGRLAVAAVYGNDPECTDAERSLSGRLTEWMALQTRPLLLREKTEQYPVAVDAECLPVVSSLISPLMHQETSFGVVCLNRFSGKTGYPFSDHDLESLQIFVLHATLLISSLRHHQAQKELDSLKSEFMANVSHELRTPLMAISGAMELLMGYADPRNEKEKIFLELINRNTQRMRFLVSELLDFSRMETNRFRLNVTRFDLYCLVKEAVQDLCLKAQEKKITVHADDIEPLEITADRERIKQVMLNLLNNAIKFTPENGTITLGYRLSDKDHVLVKVQDSGIGIPLDKQEKIFEKFYQIDGSVSRSQSGFGLGLAIVKSIVEAHQGRITVNSEPGKGALFSVLLPLNNGGGTPLPPPQG